MPPTPQQQAQLAAVAARLDGCVRGDAEPIYAEAMAAFGVSRQTLCAWLKPHRLTGRKRRCDAGRTSVSSEEARLMAAVLTTGGRKNGKQNATLKDAAAVLREGGLARLERIDGATGEIKPLSSSAISRAMKQHQLSLAQLRAPTPHQPLSSPHPNWCWQVDASVCIVFYLPMANDGKGGTGICTLKEAVHYKNKPENLKAIEQYRVIRYVATDHASGTIRVRYYPHSESGAHTVHFLAWLMAPKAARNDPFHGAPFHVMVDPGATSAGLVQRFCARLGIKLLVNKPGNPRAKGQVEQANNLWENKFEWRLQFQPGKAQDFDALNALADMFQLHFNATETHRRHRMTRFAAWLKITPRQLRTTQPAETLLALATGEPKLCRVNGDLTINFKNRVFRVHTLVDHGVAIKGKVAVFWHPFLADTAMAVMTGPDGRELHLPLEEVTAVGEFRFSSIAAEVGTEFKSNPATQADVNRQQVERLITGTDSETSALTARRDKDFVPLQGRLNPFAAAEAAPLVPFLPRAGTPLAVDAPTVASRMLSVPEAALRLAKRLGDAWQASHYAWLEKRYPEGVGEDQIERLAEQWGGNAEGVRDAKAG